MRLARVFTSATVIKCSMASDLSSTNSYCNMQLATQLPTCEWRWAKSHDCHKTIHSKSHTTRVTWLNLNASFSMLVSCCSISEKESVRLWLLWLDTCEPRWRILDTRFGIKLTFSSKSTGVISQKRSEENETMSDKIEDSWCVLGVWEYAYVEYVCMENVCMCTWSMPLSPLWCVYTTIHTVSYECHLPCYF